jgi:hypothetical protein
MPGNQASTRTKLWKLTGKMQPVHCNDWLGTTFLTGFFEGGPRKTPTKNDLK